MSVIKHKTNGEIHGDIIEEFGVFIKIKLTETLVLEHVRLLKGSSLLIRKQFITNLDELNLK